MAAEKAPAFQFYTKDWDTDANVIPMTYEEEGVYWAICRLVWNEKMVTANLDELRLLLKGKPSLLVIESWWIRIGRCFSDRNGFLFHKRIERERHKQAARRKTQRKNGLKGGRPKATANPRVSDAAISGNRKQSSSSSSSSADLKKNPHTPSREGALKVVRKDRKEAEVIRSQTNCTHEPRCETFTICVERIAAVIARKRLDVRKAS